MILLIIGLALIIISLLAAQLAVLFWVGVAIGAAGLLLMLLHYSGRPYPGGTNRRWYW